MAEEKFVTIPFDVWESKYKKLEETNNGLVSEVAKLKKDNILEIRLICRETRLWPNGVTLGNIEFDIRGIGSIHIRDKKLLENAIATELKRYDRFNGFLTPTELKELLERQKEITGQCIKASENLRLKLLKIPRIVKWLFKIKPETL